MGDDNIKVWLRNLRELLYDARDVLDEVEYEKLRRQHVHFPEVRNSSKFKPFSLTRSHFNKTLSSRIINIKDRLQDHVRNGLGLNLREGVERKPLEAISVGEKIVYGRDEDAGTILKFLTSRNFDTDSVDFITIYGKSGVGKTTLAQMVFNSESLMRHFHTKIWVDASYQDVDNNSNLKSFMKDTIEFITGTSCVLQTSSALQHLLKQKLQGQKYLLVLDNMLNDTDDFLNAIKDILINAGVNGSKILITTQKRSINKIVHPIHTHELKSLCRDDCAQVITTYAFRGRSYDANPNLNCIIEKIVDRCNGLPLIAKKYGMLLMRTDLKDWQSISKKEVMDVMRLEYDISQSLPFKMKSCFAYCSIFPEKFKFDKEQIAQQWWAQGFVSTEDEGREYFDAMINLFLFELPCFDCRKQQQTYIMPDPHRAQLISGEEFCTVKADKSHKVPEITRHASLILTSHGSSHSVMRVESSVYKAKGLHTLILLTNPTIPVSTQILKNIASKLQRLRTLDLSYIDVRELPGSIGDLKHLRYLSLCNMKIKSLPESVSKLYHLLSLRLRNCYELIKLPKDTKNLTSLRHLDLHLDDEFKQKGCLRFKPREIGKLTCLKTLSRFVVGKKAGISELREMNDLHGDLVISSLEYVSKDSDARQANLKNKEHLQTLELQWSEASRDLRVEEQVLNHLQPPNIIRELKIVGYSGYTSPPWIEDPSFCCLVSVNLINCKNLAKLPLVGKLPSLQKLQLVNLPRLRSWDRNHEGDKFSSLDELVIRNCINLTQLSASFPSLKKLEMDRCPKLIGLPQFPSLHSLKVKDSGNWIWSSLRCLDSLTSLFLSGLPASTVTTELQNCSNLRRLEMSNFNSLDSVPDDWLPTTIIYLKIENCPLLQALPSRLQCLTDLEDLLIEDCAELQSLPMGMAGLKSLVNFTISKCPKVPAMPSDEIPDGLQILSINECPMLDQWLQQQYENIVERKKNSIDMDQW